MPLVGVGFHTDASVADMEIGDHLWFTLFESEQSLQLHDPVWLTRWLTGGSACRSLLASDAKWS